MRWISSRVIWPSNGAGPSTEPILEVTREALRKPAGRLPLTDRVFLNPGFGMPVVVL